MYTTRHVTDQRIDTLNNTAMSDLPMPAHIVYEKCDVMSLTLKLISSIISLAYISTELLPPIILTLAGAVSPSQSVNDIRDMLSKFELMKDSIWNMHLHNLKTDNWCYSPPYLRSFSTNWG